MLRSLFRFLTAIVFAITSIGTVLFFLFFYFGRGLPDFQFLKNYQPAAISRLYTGDFQLFKEYAQEKRQFVRINDIPPLIIHAFLAAEDKKFYSHPGIDFLSLFRAALSNTLKGNWGIKPIGASTITQQVAKNFLVGNQRSFGRKIKEAIMSIRLESALSKDRILELYLNEIYLGMGSYGVAAAAQTYFNKALNELTIAECAFLASLPKAPSAYHPIKEAKRAKTRRDWVIERLLEDKVITLEQAEAAKAELLPSVMMAPATFSAGYFAAEVRREVSRLWGEKQLYTGGLSIFTSLEPALQEAVEQSLKKGLIAYDRRHGWRGPLMRLSLPDSENGKDDREWIKELKKIHSIPGMGEAKLAVVLSIKDTQSALIGFADGKTTDLLLENIKWARSFKTVESLGPSVKQVSDVLGKGDVILVRDIAITGAPIYELHQIPEVSGGIVVMDGDSGEVLALNGGYSYEINQFNCATQAWRQPGSAFKPFVYLAALEKGYTADSIIYDTPLEVSLGQGLGVYAPKNMSGRYYGPSPLRLGIELSRNLMTVRLANQIGMKSIQNISSRFNVVNNMPLQLAMSLGAAETTVMRLTAAYSMIVNGGKKIQPSLIRYVQDREGKIIYKNPLKVEGLHHRQEGLQSWQVVEDSPLPDLVDQREQIISPNIAQAMTQMLEGTVKRGTARALIPLEEEFKVTLGGKTGTTNDSKDAWFVGFIRMPQGRTLVVGIFVGFALPKPLGRRETGTAVAMPVFEMFVRGVMTESYR